VGAVPFALPALEPTPDALAHAAAGGTIAANAGAAAAVVSAAQAEAEQIRAAARAEGYAAGLDEARGQLGPAAVALAEALREVPAERDRAADRVEGAAVALALAVAEQALQGALAVQPERVLDAVRGALRRLAERERVTVLVHPDDLDLVREAVPDLVGELGGMGHCEVQAERRLARGGAMVRTAEGEVDATVATKLARAAETISEALRGAGEDADADAEALAEDGGPVVLEGHVV
jgi:flagellar assembly protein FliH